MRLVEPTKQTTIASRVLDRLSIPADDINVADVRIGPGYTAAMLTDNRAGVAYTFRKDAKGGCSVFHGLRPLSGRPVFGLLSLLESSDVIEAGVGLACANALANTPREGFLGGDILDHLDLRHTDHVGMVGHFGPLVQKLKERAGLLTVFERAQESFGEIRPIAEADEILPQCQVALITATSIINNTIDDLLQLVKNCREVAIVGASTPLLPEVFSMTNVTLLSGVVVNRAYDILRIVSEGGGMRQFSPYVGKVCLRVADLNS